MKRKDLGIILIIVIVSAVVSLFVSKSLFASEKAKQQSAPVIEKITSVFPPTDPRYFNKDAFDPTQTITIQQNANPDPFKAGN